VIESLLNVDIVKKELELYGTYKTTIEWRIFTKTSIEINVLPDKIYEAVVVCGSYHKFKCKTLDGVVLYVGLCQSFISDNFYKHGWPYKN
jgi:hypothetical protein